MIKVLEINDKEVTREINRLSKNLNHHSKNESRKAVSSVINKNLAKAKTQIVRVASKAMQIPAKAIRPRIKIVKSTPNDLGAKVWVGLNKITAQSAGAKPTGDGYAVGPYSWHGAFTNSRLKGIYQRKGQARTPLVSAGFGEQFTSTELKRATNYVINNKLNGDIRADLLREMSFRLQRIIQRG